MFEFERKKGKDSLHCGDDFDRKGGKKGYGFKLGKKGERGESDPLFLP